MAGAASGGRDTDPAQARAAGSSDTEADGGAGGHTDTADGQVAQPSTRPFARVDDVVVLLPAEAPVVVGYHEASSPDALELTPVGRLVSNHNTTKFDPPPDDETGSDYLVLSSRGRPNPATSSVDIVVRDETPVLSPVTGTISDVRSYYLYGEYLDHRVEVTPDEAPHLRVVLVHLDAVGVATGDRVVGGQTPLAASGMRFPFASQIDRETEPERWPHIHLEVKRDDARRPGDATDG